MPDVKFSNLYPYTDFHELNLDWVIKEVKFWSERVGKSIQTIEKTGTAGLVDTYTITYSDGTTSTFDVTNGNGIASVAKTGTVGLIDTYTITFQDGSTTTFEVHNGTASIDKTLALSDYAADAKVTGDYFRTLSVNDYLKIYDMTMAPNRGVRFVVLADAHSVITSVNIGFDYKSTENMHFGTWRVVVYGGSNTSGGVGTALYTFSGSAYQSYFDLSAAITDANSFDYVQFFIEFVYDTADYADDIILDKFRMKVNGTDRVIYGCNTWTYSQHTASYNWKSNLIPAYLKKDNVPELKKYPQLIISFIDDDTNQYAPSIWGSILSGNDDVKMGFACMTGYMNGTFVPDPGVYPQFVQMTLAQLQNFYNNGHEVYSHGWGGYSFRPLSLEDTAKECWKSKDWLYSNNFIRGAETMVYSGGADDDPEKFNVVRGYYKFGVNAWGGGITEKILDNPLYINRVIGDTLTLAQLKTYVDSYLTTGGILVFGFHSYNLNQDAANNINKLRDLIDYIRTTDAKIVPFEQAVRSICGIAIE